MRRHPDRIRAEWLGRCALALTWFGLAQVTRAEAAPPEEVAVEESADVVAPSDVPAEPTTAGEWYARGIELATRDDFAGAAVAFLRSYELQPTPEALFNAGLAFENAGDAVAAIRTYRRYLAEPQRDAALARAAEEAIAKLRREVGTLKGIRYDPTRPPAELYVDGELHQLDELPLLVAPGPLEIEVVDADGERARETYEIAAGEALVVDIRALLPGKAPEPPDEVEVDTGPSPAQLEAERRRRARVKQLRTTTWVGLGLTGAAGISLGVFTGLAVHERNTYLDQTCLDEPGGKCPEGFTPGDPEAHLLAYNRFQTGALVSAALTGGFAIGSLVVGLVSVRLDRKGAREHARVRLRPALGGLRLEF